jgi:acyl-coenzyme A thioesterase PaaI-like protein
MDHRRVAAPDLFGMPADDGWWACRDTSHPCPLRSEDLMDIRTHHAIDPELCGRPVSLSPDLCCVTLTATRRMAADDRGLVHGGFVFGLADYAAMLAVNDPHVVLGAAEVRFLQPVCVGATLSAEARVETVEGKKRTVAVAVQVDGETVFQGTFTCFVLAQHVLEG